MAKFALVLCLVVIAIVTAIVFPLPRQQSEASTPPVVEVVEAKKEEPVQTPAPTPVATKVQPTSAPALSAEPVRLQIPAIGFNNPVVKVGTDAKGDMAVPSGSTNNVGWYSRGTVPGNTGSAVIGAHVFAAFANLHTLGPGSDIYVVGANGSTLHFKVTDTKVHELAHMSADELFNRSGGRYLHLITCAGALTADGSTYTHRLVVYATLVA